MAAPSTAACSFALTLYNIVASMASPTMGINTNGSIMVNMIIMLPPFRLRLGRSEAGRGLDIGRTRILHMHNRFHCVYPACPRR